MAAFSDPYPPTPRSRPPPGLPDRTRPHASLPAGTGWFGGSAGKCGPVRCAGFTRWLTVGLGARHLTGTGCFLGSLTDFLAGCLAGFADSSPCVERHAAGGARGMCVGQALAGLGPGVRGPQGPWGDGIAALGPAPQLGSPTMLSGRRGCGRVRTPPGPPAWRPNKRPPPARALARSASLCLAPRSEGDGPSRGAGRPLRRRGPRGTP